MWRVYIRQHPTFGPFVERIDRQPAWVTRLALTATVLVIVVPLAVLALAAVAVGLVVFVTLGVVATALRAGATLWQRLTSGFGGEGRRNVRVVDRN